MSRETSLVKNTIIITIGKVCTQLITFFLLPVYTALLSTEEYGVVDLLNTLVYLFLPIVTFQIEQAIFRHLIDNRNNESEIKKSITTTLVIITVQSIIYLIIFSIISPFIHNQYKYYLATNVIAAIFSSIMLQISRGLGDNKKYAFGSFITAFTTVVLNVIFIVGFKWGAYGMLTATLIGNIVCSLYIFFSKKMYKYINYKLYSKFLLKKLWKYSLPLIPNAISWWIFNSSDRIIVSSVLGIGENGILSAAYKFSSVYITLYNIFNMTWTESASLHIDDNDNNKFFSGIINTTLKLFTAICFGIIAFMPFIFPIMINEKFGEAYNQIPILMISSLFNVVVGLISVIYIAKKDTKAVARTSIVAAIINIVVNLSLIKFIGLYAASISTLAAYLIMSLYRLYDVKKYIKLKLDKKFICSAIIMAVILFISYYINNLYLNIAIILITIIYAWLVNKNSIGAILNMFKRKFIKNEYKMNTTYLDNKNKNTCNGCGVCALVCPKKCIKMVEDFEGFLYPYIDKEKCINCGLCEKVCSNFNESEQRSEAYIAINKNEEELKKSASGGMFYILAKYAIENKGVVFGVTYDEKLNVIHQYVETLEECNKFCGSKYVRSDLKSTYKEAEKFLKDGRVVLYTGTACQISGLKSYLGKEYDNLILCDILCHANPSPKVFKLYKESLEKKYSKKVKDIKFRSKENGWSTSTPIIEFTDESKIYDSTFYRGFISQLINRPSCNTCVFASKKRISDFTIGDFWGIQNIKPELNYKDGVSLLIVNSYKAKEMLSILKNNMSILEKVDLDLAVKYNHFSNLPIHKKRDKFFEKIKSGKINKTNIIYYMNKYTKKPLYKKILGKSKKIIKKFLIKNN